jgi:hypothetical protein
MVKKVEKFTCGKIAARWFAFELSVATMPLYFDTAGILKTPFE